MRQFFFSRVLPMLGFVTLSFFPPVQSFADEAENSPVNFKIIPELLEPRAVTILRRSIIDCKLA